MATPCSSCPPRYTSVIHAALNVQNPVWTTSYSVEHTGRPLWVIPDPGTVHNRNIIPVPKDGETHHAWWCILQCRVFVKWVYYTRQTMGLSVWNPVQYQQAQYINSTKERICYHELIYLESDKWKIIWWKGVPGINRNTEGSQSQGGNDNNRIGAEDADD